MGCVYTDRLSQRKFSVLICRSTKVRFLESVDDKNMETNEHQSSVGDHCMLPLNGFSKVVFEDDCKECEWCDDVICLACGDHYADCACIGPTENDVEYIEVLGELYGKRLNKTVA